MFLMSQLKEIICQIIIIILNRPQPWSLLRDLWSTRVHREKPRLISAPSP